MNDTTPAIAQKVREMIQLKTPTERLEMGASMYETSKQLMIQFIRRRNPQISDRALRQEFFLRMYGSDFNPEERDKIAKHLGSFSYAKPFGSKND
jgi:hypothetical protein